MACSYWPKATEKRNAGSLILVVRSAERVDRVFGENWSNTEAPNGYLTPTDLNIPHNAVTKKLLYGNVFVDNSPITPFGKYCVQLTARAICNRGIEPQYIVCSPTLRSVQTGDALARFLKAKIAVEPGLLEPLAWYRSGNNTLPEFHLDLLGKMYPIDNNYSPIIPMETIQKLYNEETEAQGVERVDSVLRSLSREQRKRPLVIAGHAITLATAAMLAYPQSEKSASATTPIEQMTDLLGGEVIDQMNLGIRFPPGSVVTLNQTNRGSSNSYQLNPNVVPPLSYGEYFSNRAVLAT
ncbi:phosphoglycerate mutase family protein [Oesophagostomum dentatum]|uniref:Phosphoglycerate mutase family protein n=1 Tax=Oesophagostomum dentatum TaxID=61180 RepID=A0A0B1THK9_OESDE|nr:phosphoglycerate mutase family protein [Oesophagostomum dentatum]